MKRLFAFVLGFIVPCDTHASRKEFSRVLKMSDVEVKLHLRCKLGSSGDCVTQECRKSLSAPSRFPVSFVFERQCAPAMCVKVAGAADVTRERIPHLQVQRQRRQPASSFVIRLS